MRLDNENGDMISKYEGICRQCERFWDAGARIYFRTGYPFYFCSDQCRNGFLGITNNTGVPRERNATESTPVVQHVTETTTTKGICPPSVRVPSREERIEVMHKEKMDLLAAIVAGIGMLVAEERKRNEYLKKEADR